MHPSLVKLAAQWFDQPEKWSSFLELASAQSAIQEHWFNSGSARLRENWKSDTGPGWDLQAWDGYDRDTWWYLKDLGRDSIGIGFGWRYLWCFGARGNRVDRHALRERLTAPEYAPLKAAFGDVHEYDWNYMTWVQTRGFRFGHANDGKLSEAELAWYAGHRTDAFVEQALAKVHAFTHNLEVTALLTKLNRELQQA